MKLIYGVKDKPKFGQIIVFAIQQLLAIMAATIAVPAIVGNGMTASAALFGAGEGVRIATAFGGAVLGIMIAALLSKKQHGKNPTPAEIVSVIDDQEEL